jgi:hypothetical protein
MKCYGMSNNCGYDNNFDSSFVRPVTGAAAGQYTTNSDKEVTLRCFDIENKS